MKSLRAGIESVAVSSRGALVQAANTCGAVIRSPPSRLRQLGALLLVLPLGLIVLAVLNLSLSYAIWGELIVAWLILGFAIVGATHVAEGPLKRWMHVDPLPLWQGLSWALVVVVGLPLSYTFTPLGWLLLLGPAVTLWIAQVIIDRKAARPLGRFLMKLWIGALVGVALLVGLAVLKPKSVIDEVTPAAATPPVPGASSLAWQFRPMLFFDSAEQFIPIDIEDAIRGGRISGCKRGIVGKEGRECREVENPDGFASNLDYVTVDAVPLGRGALAGGRRSVIYYHVSRPSGTGRTYIDYWWYYAANPSPVLSRLLCGVGFSFIPMICGEHASDWEGMTVVLGECGNSTRQSSGCFVTAVGRRRVVEFHYAQHEHTFSYSWAEAQQEWAKLDNPLWKTGRPEQALVFVALNSHASYRRPCAEQTCPQSTRPLPERRNGLLPWANNDSRCVRLEDMTETDDPETDDRLACLKPLPTSPTGAPTQWNAYGGRWGPQTCVLSGAFCDTGAPPRGPAFQGRYRDPADARRD
jgi:hypothetical protein